MTEHFVDVGTLLIPLEGVNARWHTWLETVLDVVVDSQVGVDQIIEIADNFARIFIQQSLQFADIFKFVEELLELSVEVLENCKVVSQDGRKFFLVHIFSVNSRFLHLDKLLTESLVELRNFLLVIFAEAGLLLLDDLVHFLEETCLVMRHGPIALSKYLAHQLGQVL